MTFEFKVVTLSAQTDQFQNYFGCNLDPTSDVNVKGSETE